MLAAVNSRHGAILRAPPSWTFLYYGQDARPNARFHRYNRTGKARSHHPIRPVEIGLVSEFDLLGEGAQNSLTFNPRLLVVLRPTAGHSLHRRKLVSLQIM
eukprot:TRINITY_DN7166_c0_g1_i4.p3 TRINITY_DN7166_c0_g1~~TRINITY_DN7166_c0_g1_i4.p3  ORF type:complete len:101 (-),score=0.90 TRINITY_DN7166_c0_g1_i4:782-1084(-)